MAPRKYDWRMGDLAALDRYQPVGSLLDSMPPMARQQASPTLSNLSRYFTSPNPPTNQVVRPGAMGNAPVDQAEIQIPGTFDPNAIWPDDTMRQYFEKDKSQENL